MSLSVNEVIDNPNNASITIDGCIPFDIKVLNRNWNTPLYWRVGNGKTSLLEVAVLPENGFLSSVTLVIIDPESVHKVDTLQLNISGDVHGLPVVDLKLWGCSGDDDLGQLFINDFSQCFIDEFNLDIQAFVYPESILLTIGNNKTRTAWIKCSENFYLGTDDRKNISNLFLDKLTQGEIENFLESIG